MIATKGFSSPSPTQSLCFKSHIIYILVESLAFTPETNIMLCVNYTKKKKVRLIHLSYENLFTHVAFPEGASREEERS